ncbi:MAG: molybdenum transporter permease [Paenibacillaceae bacterium]|jgi:molybdate transport system permease protein|nr:molybdenum transporter permease [Paenibacillaceae bacterium]
MMDLLTKPEFLNPLKLSLKVSLFSSIIVFLIGILVAWIMTTKRVKGKTLLETVFLLPMVLPPTVIGFILLVLVGRRTWFGKLVERLFDQSFIFSWWAAVAAAVVVAFPLVYQSLKSGFLSIERELQDSARSMGATEWQVLLHITMPLAWRAMVTGYVLGFARGLGEFGATLMVAGNIPGRTQTIPTGIYFAVDSGNTTLAWLLSGATIAISFIMLLFTGKLKSKS